MHNGDTRRLRAGLIALTAAGLLTACTPADSTDAAAPAAPAAARTTAPSAPAEKHFGPDGFGKLTVGITEKDALATGEIQPKPVSTVLGKNVYSFPGGPAPDAKRMAADQKIEKAVAKAEASDDTSARGSADAAQAYADSTQRIYERLEAYLKAGGASFKAGKLQSIAAPKDATTAEGIQRGSTLAQLKTAYGSSGLKSSGKAAWELPATGHPGWSLLFEMKGTTVLYMSLGQSG